MSINEKDEGLRPSDVESVKGLSLFIAEVDRPYALKCELGTFFGLYQVINNPILNGGIVNKCLQEECVVVHIYVYFINIFFHRIGFGRYQYQLFILTGLGWMADSMYPISNVVIHPTLLNYLCRHLVTRCRSGPTTSATGVVTCSRRICHSGSIRWTNSWCDYVGRYGGSNRT
jgi:hypothetical protein